MRLVVEAEDRSHKKKRIVSYGKEIDGFEVGPYIEGFSKHTHHWDEVEEKIVSKPYPLSPEEEAEKQLLEEQAERQENVLEYVDELAERIDDLEDDKVLLEERFDKLVHRLGTDL